MLAFYKYSHATQTFQLSRIRRDPELVNDTAPKIRWNVDLLSEQGYVRLVQLAAEVKAMVSALGYWHNVLNLPCCDPRSTLVRFRISVSQLSWVTSP